MLCGREYWQPLVDWSRSTLLPEGCISPEDIDMLRLLDDPAEISETIVNQCRAAGYL